MFPLKNTMANKRCMLLQKWQAPFLGRYSAGWECRECLLKFTIPEVQEMSFNSTLQQTGVCSFLCSAASVVQALPWWGWETILSLSIDSSRKYCIKFLQALSIFQSSFARKALKNFSLKHFFAAIIVPICAASTMWWWPGCCISLHSGGRIPLLLFYREHLKIRIKCLVQCLNGAEMNSELWSHQTLTSIIIPLPCSKGFC